MHGVGLNRFWCYVELKLFYFFVQNGIFCWICQMQSSNLHFLTLCYNIHIGCTFKLSRCIGGPLIYIQTDLLLCFQGILYKSICFQGSHYLWIRVFGGLEYIHFSSSILTKLLEKCYIKLCPNKCRVLFLFLIHFFTHKRDRFSVELSFNWVFRHYTFIVAVKFPHLSSYKNELWERS